MADFQKQKDEFARMQLELKEVDDRQNAEREADELMKRQEEERKQHELKEAIDRQNADISFENNKVAMINKTVKAIEKYIDTELLVHEIIAGAIPNVRWVI